MPSLLSGYVLRISFEELRCRRIGCKMNFDVVAVAMEAPSLGRAAYDNTMEALLTLESDGQLDR